MCNHPNTQLAHVQKVYSNHKAASEETLIPALGVKPSFNDQTFLFSGGKNK
jgi:hypothetical protein